GDRSGRQTGGFASPPCNGFAFVEAGLYVGGPRRTMSHGNDGLLLHERGSAGNCGNSCAAPPGGPLPGPVGDSLKLCSCAVGRRRGMPTSGRAPHHFYSTNRSPSIAAAANCIAAREKECASRSSARAMWAWSLGPVLRMPETT